MISMTIKITNRLKICKCTSENNCHTLHACCRIHVSIEQVLLLEYKMQLIIEQTIIFIIIAAIN